MIALNETHDPKLQSFVASANDGKTDFPIQNLPFAVFRRKGSNEGLRGGVAIGDQVLDLTALANSGLLQGIAQTAAQAAAAESLNGLMALGHAAWSALRLSLSRLLRNDSAQRTQMEALLVAQSQVEYTLPARVGDYTDFYTSIHHATNVGKLFRPDNPLLPNYKWVPIGYHGRCSSLGVSGQQLRRPVSQLCPPGQTEPTVGPSKRLDYELEMGVFVGQGNALGMPIPVNAADQHIFGLCLLNDWSARDVQAWEYQPLGPFLAKNFGTTLSPWIITLEALAPYRVPFTRDSSDPQPLPYLDSPEVRDHGQIDIQLEVLIETPGMQQQGKPAALLGRSNLSTASYWTIQQIVAHHTVNGCNLQPGDLLGTGTLSGPTPDSLGSLLEMTQGGKQPVTLSNGEQRTFIEDGDSIILRGYCQRDGLARIGFGESRGQILAAR